MFTTCWGDLGTWDFHSFARNFRVRLSASESAATCYTSSFLAWCIWLISAASPPRASPVAWLTLELSWRREKNPRGKQVAVSPAGLYDCVLKRRLVGHLFLAGNPTRDVMLLMGSCAESLKPVRQHWLRSGGDLVLIFHYLSISLLFW